LISVNAGTLTITEVAQTGYTAADIYTIPANRLISKDLNGGSARVNIVKGTAASQTIVIFRNRAVTAPCQPEVIYATFDRIPAGQSVEGPGTAAQYLNIKAKRQAVRVLQATAPRVHIAPNDSADANGGLIADGGFSDLLTQKAKGPHHYTFTFDPGISVTNFSLHMLDYGDYNPSLDPSHYVSMTAYDAGNNVISKEELSYTTPAESRPRSSSLYGDLWFNGDAVHAPLGQPGNWIWSVSGSGIVKVILEFGAGYDPNIAFDQLYFTIVRNE
jgi:hypothetical protein